MKAESEIKGRKLIVKEEERVGEDGGESEVEVLRTKQFMIFCYKLPQVPFES